jgi:hypothetical protein
MTSATAAPPSSPYTDAALSARIRPVVMWLTSTFGAHSRASARVSASSPAFAAE